MFKKCAVTILLITLVLLVVGCIGNEETKKKNEMKKYAGHYEATYSVLDFASSRNKNIVDTLVLTEDGKFEWKNNLSKVFLYNNARSDSGDWWVKDNKIVFQGKDYFKESCSLDINWDEWLSEEGKKKYKNKKLTFMFRKAESAPYNQRWWVKID